MPEARELLRPRPLLRLSRSQEPDAATLLLKRSIASRTCVTALYNKGRVKLAPCILYRRDDVLFVDAFTLERDGQPPRELKLGAFRLSGLSDVRPTTEEFAVQPDGPLDDGRYSAGILARL